MDDIQFKLDKILTTFDILSKRIDDIETALNMTNDNLKKIDRKLSKHINDLENEMDHKVNLRDFEDLKQRVSDLEKQQESDRKARLEQLNKDAYSKRFNLIIHGLEENKNKPWETREKTEAIFAKFLFEGLGIKHKDVILADFIVSHNSQYSTVL